MKYLSVIAVLLVSAAMLFATTDKAPVASTTINGVVIDHCTGEALAGVKINLDEQTTVYSDLEGNFEIENVSAGNHVLKTDLISYTEENINIEITDEKTNLEIKMKNK